MFIKNNKNKHHKNYICRCASDPAKSSINIKDLNPKLNFSNHAETNRNKAMRNLGYTFLLYNKK